MTLTVLLGLGLLKQIDYEIFYTNSRTINKLEWVLKDVHLLT